MKKLLGVVLSSAVLVLVVPPSAGADVTFDLGVKGGVSFGSITYSFEGEADNSSSSIMPVIGGFLSINFNKTLTFQPEVYFLTSGGKWTWNDEIYAYKQVERVRSIHVPLLAKAHLADRAEKALVPILFAGPALDIIMSAKGKFYENGVLLGDYDFKDDLKGTNISAVLGGGVEIMMDKLMIVLEARYVLGLVNLYPDADEVYKFKAVMVMAGLGF